MIKKQDHLKKTVGETPDILAISDGLPKLKKIWLSLD